jgi:putative transposase
MYSSKKIVQIIKSITGREIFKQCPLVKKQLWGGELWTDGYFVTAVGKHGNEDVIRDYVKNQGNDLYKELHKAKLKEEQLLLW